MAENGRTLRGRLLRRGTKAVEMRIGIAFHAGRLVGGILSLRTQTQERVEGMLRLARLALGSWDDFCGRSLWGQAQEDV